MFTHPVQSSWPKQHSEALPCVTMCVMNDDHTNLKGTDMNLTDLKLAILNQVEPGDPYMTPALHVEDLSDHNSDSPTFHFRFVYPMGYDAYTDTEYRTLAYDTTTEAFSNMTNNDACDVIVRERSAHLDAHDDLTEYHHLPFASVVILDVTVEDYLT